MKKDEDMITAVKLAIAIEKLRKQGAGNPKLDTDDAMPAFKDDEQVIRADLTPRAKRPYTAPDKEDSI